MDFSTSSFGDEFRKKKITGKITMLFM